MDRIRLLIISLFILLSGCVNSDISNINSRLNNIELRIESMKIKISRMLHPRTKLLQVTGYSPRVQECDSTPYVNAYNKRVKLGTVAVSPDLFVLGWTFGREIYIKGYGVFEIQDLMNERHTNRVDIFFWETDKAIKFGNKLLEVTLLGV